MKQLSRKTKSDIIFWSILFLFAGYLFLTPSGQNTRAWLISLTLSSPHSPKSSSGVQVNTPWILTSTDGTTVNLSAINKPVFINIWATWCPPCRAELPSIILLQNKYKGRVIFLLVSPDEPLDKLKRFAEEGEYSVPFYNSSGRIPDELMVSVYPTTFILDRNKQIILESSGAHNWNSTEVHQLLDDLLESN